MRLFIRSVEPKECLLPPHVWQDAAFESGLRKKNVFALCRFCSDPAEAQTPYTISGGGRKIKVLPFLAVFPCSGVTSPGVDNNGVILLSVAASLTLTDNFSTALVYHSFLSWHGAECFPIGVLSTVWLGSDYSGENKSLYNRPQNNEMVFLLYGNKNSRAFPCHRDNHVIGLNVPNE